MKQSKYLLFIGLITLILSLNGFSQIPTPESFFGHKPGADFHLITFEKALDYFQIINAASDRMLMFDMGPTTGGRRMKYAVISAEENLRRLDEFKSMNRRLALVKDITDADAAEIAENGKAIVWIDGGLHGTEVAPAQLLPQLAYDLVIGEDRKTQKIRDEVITLLVFANPDGMTIVSDWYMGNVGTPYEVSRLPWLYHEYVGHDNNRDSFMSNLIETQNMNRATSQEWFPVILYNQHQTGPFPARIWIPPDSEPTNPNVHPLIIRWKNLIGSAMGRAFDAADQPGAISRVRYDTWYPGYATQVVDGHNTISILTETQLYRYATPQFFQLRDFPKEHQDLTKGVFYPNPWLGGWWRLGDAVAYNHTACMAVLETAARYRRDLLLDKYKIGRDVIQRFNNEPPYGWIIPAKQDDAASTALLLDRLMINGIQVFQADEHFEYAGLSFPKGTTLIPASQSFGLFAKNMMELQHYPDLRDYPHLWQGLVGTTKTGRQPLRAYDGAGWTLPVQMGVATIALQRPVDVPMTRIERSNENGGRLTGGGSHFILSRKNNGTYAALPKILKAGGRIETAMKDFSLGSRPFSQGSFIVKGGLSRAQMNRIAGETISTVQLGKADVSSKRLRMPSIALYKSWVASMDAGWIRYIFDEFGWDLHAMTDAEVRVGRLNDRFDVILLPDQRASSILNGHKKGTMPPDYIGGMTKAGADHIKQFVEDGGILVCNKSSSQFAIDLFDLPLRNMLQDVKSDSFACPGSILKMTYDTNHPLAYGMAEDGIANFSRGLVFGAESDSSKKEILEKGHKLLETGTVGRYPDEPLLISGWIHGGKTIRGQAAVIDVPVGKGRVVLFGFNVHNRSQAHATIKLLFNACLMDPSFQ